MKRFIRQVFLWGLSFFSLLPIASSSTACVGPYFERAEELYSCREYEAAGELYKSLLNETSLTACSTYLYYRLGRVSTRLSSFSDADEYFQKALNLTIVEENLLLKVKILSRLAEVFSKTGEYEAAFSWEMEALQIATALEDSAGISRSRYQLGGFAYDLGRFEEALENYLEVDKLIAEEKVGPRHASLWGAIGLIYLEQGQLELAIKYLESSAETARNFDRDEILAYTLGNLASAYVKVDDDVAAENYFRESLLLQKRLEDDPGLISSKLDYGIFLTLRHRFKEAEDQISEATDLAKKIDAKNKLMDGYEALTQLFKENKKFEQALFYKEAASELKDVILDEQTLNRIENVKAQYEIERNELEIERLQEVQEQKDLNYQFRKKAFFITVCIMFFVFVYGLHMNNRLQKQNAKLEDSGRMLAAKNEELQSFAYVASHDLKEPLRTINSFAGLLRRRYGNQLDDRALEYVGHIMDGVHRMKNLLEDLLDYSRVDHTDEGKEVINSRELIHSAIGQLNAQIEKKHAQIYFITNDFPQIEVIPSQIIQLFQNLIANAIKFSNGNQPEVEIDCARSNNNLYQFSVKDNGIGIAPEHADKIFEMFTRLHSREEYDGTGIGLATCRKIVEKYGGKIWVESLPGQGATFYFTLPAHVAEEEILTVY